MCEERPQVALLGTLSKVGFAGIRVGWVRLDPALSAELEKVRQPFNLGTASQVIARLALTDLALLESTLPGPGSVEPEALVHLAEGRQVDAGARLERLQQRQQR